MQQRSGGCLQRRDIHRIRCQFYCWCLRTRCWCSLSQQPGRENGGSEGFCVRVADERSLKTGDEKSANVLGVKEKSYDVHMGERQDVMDNGGCNAD